MLTTRRILRFGAGLIRPSLNRRLAIVIIFSIVAFQVQAILHIYLFSNPELRVTGVRHLSEATLRAVQDALRLGRSQRASYFAERTIDPDFKIWWSMTPLVAQSRAGATTLDDKLVATLQQVLGNAAHAVHVSNSQLSHRFPNNAAQVIFVPEQIETKLSRTAVGPDGPDELLATSAKVAVRLADGTWINVQHSSFVDTAFGSTLPISPLVVGGLMIAAISMLWARYLVSPLNRLVDAANRVGHLRDPILVEKSGLHEFAAVAEAFEDMQQRLLSIVEGRTQMLAAVSHDLRSALMRLQLIAERSQSNSQRAAMIAQINEMALMLESTMAFASGEAKLLPDQPTDVASLLISLVDEAADAGGDCHYDGPNHAEIVANPVSLKRAFRNVIDNALKYGGSACVMLIETNEELLVEVKDSGPGISPENFEKAFAPFERLDAARSNVVTGGGLGLTIARDVTQSHGGSIDLYNHEPHGLTVAIRLPQSN